MTAFDVLQRFYSERCGKVLLTIHLSDADMVRVLLVLALIFLLVACNTPGRHFRGLNATRVTVDASTFDVRVRGELAQAIRVNSEYAPRFGPVRERARRAMAQVSGCLVKNVRGDQALTTGLLDCRKRDPGKKG